MRPPAKRSTRCVGTRPGFVRSEERRVGKECSRDWSSDVCSSDLSWPFAAYDVARGRRIWQRPDVHSAFHVDLNPRGTLLALEFFETQRDALLVDAATGETVHTLRGHQAWVREIGRASCRERV